MSRITIKPHSTTKHLFTQEQDSYEVEVSTYGELISYLENVHPRVAEHIKNPSDDCTPISILNSQFERLEERGTTSTRFVEDGVLHVCALFGGEKRIVTRVVRSIAKVVRSIGRAIKRGIDHIKRWFTDDIPTGTDPEEINNEGNLFGSIAMAQQEGNRIALIFGQMRVGGQFISGSVISEKHMKAEEVKVSKYFNLTPANTNANNGFIIHHNG